jgi:hypothetical protein
MELIRKIQKLIRRHVDFALSHVHTHIPAQVISYDSGDNTVSVQPCIKVLRTTDPDNDTIELPVIEDVPVSLLGSGKCLLTVAPQAGSYGVLHVAERSLERWILEGGVVEPGSVRKFDISDCFFVPGIYPTVTDGDNGKLQSAVATDRIEIRTRSGDTTVSVLDDETVEIKNASATIAIDSSGNVNIDAPKLILNTEADAVALASKIDTLWTKLDTVFRTAWIVAPTDGGAALKAAYIAAFVAPPTTVGSTKMKLDS